MIESGIVGIISACYSTDAKQLSATLSVIMDQSHKNTGLYADAIERARRGEQSAERFLRMRMKSMSDTMPVSALVAISETMLTHRNDELRRETESN